MNILDKMLEKCQKEGFCPTPNAEKIAKAKNMMFGETQWERCPCDGQNEERYCISDVCRQDIDRDGVCHCHCYTKTALAR